ncbi:MAG: PQQ-binding-like beta-propeller repeat protein [bacterium]|nr:PQQ-binding-like beta-propeller repeat protein [bacterium]
MIWYKKSEVSDSKGGIGMKITGLFQRLNRLLIGSSILSCCILLSYAENPLTLGEFSAQVNACSFSPDGTRVIAASENGEVKIWDWASKTLRNQFTPEDGASVISASYSPDGSEMMTVVTIPGIYAPEALFWDASSLSLLRSFPLASAIASYSPDGSKILSNGDQGLVIHDAQTGGHLARLTPPEQPYVNFATYSPDGETIALQARTGISLWDAETHTLRAVLQGHRDPVADLAFSRSGDRLFSLDSRGVIISWNAVTGARLLNFPSPVQLARRLFSNPESEILYVLNANGEVASYDAVTGERRSGYMGIIDGRPFDQSYADIRFAGLHPTQPLIAAGDADGGVRIIDVSQQNDKSALIYNQATELIESNEFNAGDVESNGLVLYPGGFSGKPSGSIEFGEIPLAKPKRQPPAPSDGSGVKITVGPGQVMTFLASPYEALSQTSVSCFVKVEGGPPASKDLAISIGVVPDGSSEDLSLTTYSKTNAYFSDYRLITSICPFPLGMFRPLIQAANNSAAGTYTVYIDNLWVHELPNNNQTFRFVFEQSNRLLQRQYHDDPIPSAQ